MDNLVENHLSRLPDEVKSPNIKDIIEQFCDEKLLMMSTAVTTWYAYILNHLVNRYVPLEYNSPPRKRFYHFPKDYLWDKSVLYKKYDGTLL